MSAVSISTKKRKIARACTGTNLLKDIVHNNTHARKRARKLINFESVYGAIIVCLYARYATYAANYKCKTSKVRYIFCLKKTPTGVYLTAIYGALRGRIVKNQIHFWTQLSLGIPKKEWFLGRMRDSYELKIMPFQNVFSLKNRKYFSRKYTS